MEEFRLFVGIDWGYSEHAVCILDENGAIVREFDIKHSGSELARLVDGLVAEAEGDVTRLAVAIENPRGAVVETLIDRSIAVYAIAPKQLDRFRDRHTTAGAKDDRLDARVAADAVRTDRAKLRRICLSQPLLVRLREISRMERTLAKDAARLHNRLRDQLHRYFPQLLALSPAADEPWLWELVARAATPEAAKRLHLNTLHQLLRKWRIRRITPEKLQDVLHEPAVVVAAGVTESAAQVIGLIIPLLWSFHEQRRQCQRLLDQLLEEAKATEPDTTGQYRDAVILDSLPGVGRVVAVTILAEAPQALAERDLQRLRTEMGVAPVTRRSGKMIVRQMRRACNRHLRDAAHYWGMGAVLADPHWNGKYRAMRDRGLNHSRALRSVVDALLRVLIAMLRNNTLYDASRLHQTSTNSI